MKKIKIDGKEFEVNEDLFGAIEGIQTSLTEAKNDASNMKKKSEEDEEEMKKLKKKMDETEAKKDSLETEVQTLKEAQKENKMDHEQIDALVQERADVCDVAGKIIKDFKKDGKSNLDIKKEVISSISPDLKLDEKSEDYINARFDAISENDELFKDHLKDAMNKKDGDDVDNKETKVDAEEARKKMMEESQNAWKRDSDK